MERIPSLTNQSHLSYLHSFLIYTHVTHTPLQVKKKHHKVPSKTCSVVQVALGLKQILTSPQSLQNISQIAMNHWVSEFC